MQQFSRLASSVSSPAILIVVVWFALLLCVGLGPLDYPGQPSSTVLILVAGGISLFVLGHSAGLWCFGSWFEQQANVTAPLFRRLNRVVITTSLIGIGGIGLIALDRLVLSGVSNSGYAELLRCAPGLVDFIEIRRTPLLYVGYLTFSFGFASLVLFLLKGEEIRGWAAVLAQFSIVSPVGYALLYSGRMPIMFILVLILSVMLVRISQGRPPLPHGHYLVFKMAIVVLLFAIYSSAIWSRRSNFCVQMSGVIQELQQRKSERDKRKAGSIQATDVSKFVTDASKRTIETMASPDALLRKMRESWSVQPRSYIFSAMKSGNLPPGTAVSFLSTYFYFTHGVRIIDMTWRAREQFSPQWGVYEIGILSPILRVFFPQDQGLADMEAQLRSAGIYGFFPTAWGAAYIDFGAAGAIIYILIWGFMAGWSVSGVRRSTLVTPPLLLTFFVASIVLSPVQGPLGVANSALVLLSMIVTGAAIDFKSLGDDARQAFRGLKLRRSAG